MNGVERGGGPGGGAGTLTYSKRPFSDVRPPGRPGLPAPRPMAPGVASPPRDPKDQEPMAQRTQTPPPERSGPARLTAMLAGNNEADASGNKKPSRTRLVSWPAPDNAAARCRERGTEAADSPPL